MASWGIFSFRGERQRSDQFSQGLGNSCHLRVSSQQLWVMALRYLWNWLTKKLWKMGWWNGQAIEHLSSKCEALSSNPSTNKIKRSLKNTGFLKMHCSEALSNPKVSCSEVDLDSWHPSSAWRWQRVFSSCLHCCFGWSHSSRVSRL
jgi:hypothetical protein